MLCPKCKVDLKFKERNNKVINHCTRCHGVWFDEELDELRRKRVAARQSRGQSEASPYQTAYGFRQSSRRPREGYAARSSLISRYWQMSERDNKAAAF